MFKERSYELGSGSVGEKAKGLSVFSAIVFIVGELAGSGVLALPNALASTGWAGIVIIICSGLTAGYSGVCLARCWLMLEERWPEYGSPVRNPFASIGYRSNGNWMKYACSAVLDITFFGASVVYLLLCAELIHSITDPFIIYLTFCDWILIIAILILPLSWLGSPADFWPVAFGAIFTSISGLILLMINVIIDSPTYLPQAEYKAPNFSTFFLGFGTIVFAFGGAAAFPTFQNDMKDKTKFPIAVVIGFIGLIVLYLPVSIAGFTVYGSTVATDILNTVTDGPLRITIMALFAIHLFLALLILINPVAQEFEGFANIPQHFTWKRCVMRSLIMFAIAFTASSVPQFGKILSLIGGSTVTLMTFVMPPLFYIRLSAQTDLKNEWPKRTISRKVKVFLGLTVVIGVMAGIAATYSALQDMIDPQGFSSPCYLNLKSYYNS